MYSTKLVRPNHSPSQLLRSKHPSSPSNSNLVESTTPNKNRLKHNPLIKKRRPMKVVVSQTMRYLLHRRPSPLPTLLRSEANADLKRHQIGLNLLITLSDNDLMNFLVKILTNSKGVDRTILMKPSTTPKLTSLKLTEPKLKPQPVSNKKF